MRYYSRHVIPLRMQQLGYHVWKIKDLAMQCTPRVVVCRSVAESHTTLYKLSWPFICSSNWMVVPPTILCMSCLQRNIGAVKGSTMVHLAVGLHAKPFASRRIFLLHLSPFLTQHTCLVSLRMLCSMLCYLVQNRCISPTCVGTRHVLNHRLSSCTRCYSHFLENAFQLMWPPLLLLCCHMT